MPNPRRGEVAVTLGGERRILCLTLGALAELEAAFGVADLAGLGERLAGGRLSARDLMTLLCVGLRGGGDPATEEEVAALPLAGDLERLVEAVSAMLAAAFGETPANPPEPQEA